MIFCDLPYGTTACKWDIIIPFDKLWKEYKRVIKDNGAIVLFSAQPFTSALITSNPKMFRYDIIYEKTKPTGFLNAKKMPMRYHEEILVFYKKLPTYNPIMTNGHNPLIGSMANHKSSNYGEYKSKCTERQKGGSTTRYPKSVLKFDSILKGHLHPTQKPLSLIEYMIRTYSNEGDLILDNCAGSGTTGLGAKNLNRNYIMMEQDPKYFEIAKARVGE